MVSILVEVKDNSLAFFVEQDVKLSRFEQNSGMVTIALTGAF